MLMIALPDDVRTILGGLMSGGFETILATAIAGIAYLASPAGQAAQEKAYFELIGASGDAEVAFKETVEAEKSPYLVAFVRETLRHYPPLHILPPRQVYQEFEWEGAKLPKGLMILANAQAINHGTSSSLRLPIALLGADNRRSGSLWCRCARLSAREMD